MSLSWIDWTMMIVAVIAIRSVSFVARNYMRGVSDFLAANRSAGRYLLTISSAMGNMGVISFISNYQMYLQAGFTGLWWGMAGWVTGPALTLAGWIYFRFRETRAMTLPQFLEMRYSRNFRVFAGIVVFTSGIINFAVMPAAAAWFFVYFFGWRARYYGMTLLGHRLNFPIIDTMLTLPSFHQGHLLFSPHHIHHPIAVSIYAIVMAIDLILALYFVTQGGQVSVMITECVQGMFSAFAILIIVGLLMTHISWDHVVTALKTAPPNASMLHPFHNGT